MGGWGGWPAGMEIKCMRGLRTMRMMGCRWAGEDPEVSSHQLYIMHGSHPRSSLVVANSHWMNPSRVLYRAGDYRLFHCKPITWPHTAIYKPIKPSKHPVFSDHHCSPAAQSFPSNEILITSKFWHLIGELFLFKTHASMHKAVCSHAWPPGAGLGRSLCLKRRLSGTELGTWECWCTTICRACTPPLSP